MSTFHTIKFNISRFNRQITFLICPNLKSDKLEMLTKTKLMQF